MKKEDVILGGESPVSWWIILHIEKTNRGEENQNITKNVSSEW